VTSPGLARAAAKILVVDDDRDTADIMQAVLTDDGYAASVIYHSRGKFVQEAIVRLEPDCVLLDSSPDDPGGYGESWQTAAWIASRDRNVPVIMITGHRAAADEAIAARSKRARAAEFAAVIRKPYDIDEFLVTLGGAVQRGVVRRASDSETLRRVTELREKLTAAGAREISTSTRRVWATFRGAEDELVQIYWWEKLSVYLVGRYTPDGLRLEPLGQYTDVSGAIAAALP
jgi:FixJ family two-component response regulator